MKIRGSNIIRSSMALALVLAILVAPISISQSPVVEKNGTPEGWSDDVRLTYASPDMDAYTAISVWESQVHITWRKLLGDRSNIYYINSTNAGQTWHNQIRLSNGVSGIYCMYPDIAVNNSNIHVVWSDNDAIGIEIKYRNSSDGGITWSTTKMISVDDGEYSEAPLIAVSNSNIHVIWVDSRNASESSPPNTEIYYVRSTDGGITWDDGLGNIGLERRLTNAPYASAPRGITVNGNVINILWFDGRNGVSKGDIYYKRSLDNGATWDDGQGYINQDRRITTNSSDHMDGSIAVNNSTIHIVWRDAVGSDYYIYYRNSTDDGATWGPVQLLTGPFGGRPKLDAYNDTVYMVWHDNRDGSGREIYYKNSTNAGADWSTDLRLTYSEGSDSWWPEVDVQGNTVHVTWYDQRDGNPEIYYKRYPDFPPDTTPPSHSNETPPPESYKDAPGTNVSVHVTDSSGVNTSTIQLYINGSPVSTTLTPIINGYNVSYASPGFSPSTVTCRIVAKDNYGNQLDYTWNFTVLATYVIPLRQGWNLMSVPLAQVNTSISEVLKGIAGKWDYIQVYNATEPDHWKTNMTYRPDQLNDLKLLNHKMGFWINITEPNVNLTIRGNISAYTIIPLYAGWNLVGYPTLNSTMTVGNALFGTTADRVEVFNATDPYRTKEVASTYIMKPGEGYWVHVVADSTWVINW